MSSQSRFVGLKLLLGLGCAVGVPSEPAGAGPPATGRALALQQQARQIVAAYEHGSKAVCGLVAKDLRTGEKLIDIRGQELFIPASNQKLLTTAFAVARLGKDFQFTTQVCRLGRDLLVIGDGDPVLGDPHLARKARASIYAELDRWSAAVKEKSGGGFPRDMLVCSNFPPGSYRHGDWPASQHNRWYAAPVAALNFHNNCFAVSLAVRDKEVTARISPASRYIQVRGSIRRGKRQIWSLRLTEDDSVLRLSGTAAVATVEPLMVAANDPPMLLARVFADRLARTGAALGGTIRTVRPGELDLAAAKPICRTRTPLVVALGRANKRSLNMAAECVFLRAGDGTWDGSARIMTDVLVKHFALPAGELVVRDGGGLSRSNRVSPRAMVKLLGTLARLAGSADILAGLSSSGIDGLLRRRLAAAPYKGRILAKTGTLTGACCLSGYVLARDGRVVLAFAVLANRVPAGGARAARGLQDSICRLLVNWLDKR